MGNHSHSHNQQVRPACLPGSTCTLGGKLASFKKDLQKGFASFFRVAEIQPPGPWGYIQAQSLYKIIENHTK